MAFSETFSEAFFETFSDSLSRTFIINEFESIDAIMPPSPLDEKYSKIEDLLRRVFDFLRFFEDFCVSSRRVLRLRFLRLRFLSFFIVNQRFLNLSLFFSHNYLD